MIADCVKQSLSYLDFITERYSELLFYLEKFADVRAMEHLEERGLVSEKKGVTK